MPRTFTAVRFEGEAPRRPSLSLSAGSLRPAWKRRRERSWARREPSAAAAWVAWALLVVGLLLGGSAAAFGGGLLVWVSLSPAWGLGLLGAGLLFALWGIVGRR